MSCFPEHNEGDTGIDASTGALTGFDDLSDEALIGSAGTSPLHLIALYERYKGLVSELATQRPLSQRIWFTIFEILERDPQSLLPVEEKLTQMVEKFFGARLRSEKTFLPDPLAWYLCGVLNTLPQPLRIILLLVEVEQRSPAEIAGFLAERGFGVTVLEVADAYAQAKDLLVKDLPAVVSRFYFDGVIDCLSLTPWLHLDIADEIQNLDTWKQIQTRLPQTASVSTPRKQYWWMAIPVALSLFAIGVVALPPRQAILSHSTEVSVLPPSAIPIPPRAAPPNAPTWSGKTYLLVADPGPEGFAKLQTIDRKVYYRKHQGKPHVQIGVFATRSSAEATGKQVNQLGFKPLFAPEIRP